MKYIILGLIAVCLWSAASASAQVEPVITYQYYPVTPEVGRSLYNSLLSDTPLSHEGHKAAGLAKTPIKYHLRYSQTTIGMCRVKNLEVTCECEVILPQLQSDDPGLKSDFAAYLALLKEHELTHCRISAVHAGRFQETALALGERRCDTMKDDVMAIFNRMHAELGRDQKRFDDNTRMGGYQSRKARILLGQPKRSAPMADGGGLANLPEPAPDDFWSGPAYGDPEAGSIYKDKDGVWRNH